MSYVTFFEIGGHVVETYVDEPGMPVMKTPQRVLKEQFGVPTPLGKRAVAELKKETNVDVGKFMSAGGRAKRVAWALRTAAALALVDGPIPVGDAAAAGFLVVYAGYEVTRSIIEVKEGLGY